MPQNFSREDLRKLEESKAAMRKDSDDYVNEMLENTTLTEKSESNIEMSEKQEEKVD